MERAEMGFLNPASAPHREFPPSLRSEYRELMGWFGTDPRTEGFKRMDKRQGLNDSSAKGVAHRAYWWFPAHFFKFQDALLRWEGRCRESKEPFLLGRSKVTFLDLGCGAGAASAAVLAVLEQYQGWRRRGGNRLETLRVHLLGVDEVGPELEAYQRLVGGYASRLRSQRVYASTRVLQARFPRDLDEILEAVSGQSGHVLVIGMSNLVNWIWNDWDAHAAGADGSQVGVLPPGEEDALMRLTGEVDFDCVHVIGTATKRKVHLKDKLRQLFDRYAARLFGAGRSKAERGSFHAAVLYANPEYCGWANERDSYSTQYYVENLRSWSARYVGDKRLQRALSRESLEAAWAKVRSYMQYESLTDEVELRLFEADLEDNLQALRVACLDRDSGYLNVAWSMSYEFPKAEASTRPRSLPRMEEQILAVAIALEFERELEGPCKGVCYSYRVASRQSEFLYDYWFALYRKCLAHVLKHLDSGYVFLGDIKSYYTNISQSILLDLLGDRLCHSERCLALLRATVDRHCGPGHDVGYGLVQGHALSGLLGNVMLQPADWRLVGHRGWASRYCRFTDDITVAGTDGPAGSTRDSVQQELADLDCRLKLNPGKTEYLGAERFRRKARGSRQLDEIAKRFRALLLPLFLLDGEYRAEFNREQWAFAHKYQGLLSEQGVYLTPGWLCRKLEEHGQLRRRAKSLRRRWRLKWPPVSLLSSESGRVAWGEMFGKYNMEWLADKQRVQTRLIEMLITAERAARSSRLTDEQVARRRRELRFAVYRLSVLGVGDAAITIVSLLTSRPWLVPVGIACTALARIGEEPALLEVIKCSDSSFVRAAALKVLGGAASDEATSVLVSVLESEADAIEKLMASEALLWRNRWQGIEPDRVLGWIHNEGESPYVQKNLVLVLAECDPTKLEDLLSHWQCIALHPVVDRALHYAVTKIASESLLRAPEPPVLQKYRATYYPIIEELLGDVASYGLFSD
ncbi:MAG TPA: hypothetical protein VM075_09180 [Anaerolineae bacterium]|nr:hypothetical protein [Anaerolineae bacterium]